MNHLSSSPIINSVKKYNQNILFYVRLILSCLAWYTAIYWVADSRYNRELARLEARVTNIITRLEGNNWRKAIEDIPILQRTLVPFEPLFFDFISVYKSLNPAYDIYDSQVVIELSKMLIAHKEELNKLNLSSAVINPSNIHNNHSMLDLSNCNFADIDLSKASLENILYINATLELGWFVDSDMSFAHYISSNLSKAKFINTQMNNCFFDKVKLDNTNFEQTNLEDSYIVGVDFSKSINLNTANLKFAIYNSKEIIETINYDSLLKSQELEYCQHQKLESCFLTKYAITPKPKTLFPTDFSPEAHGMIDLSDFIDYIKEQKKLQQ